VKHGGKNVGRGASSGDGGNRGIFQSVSKNVDFMEKQLETFVQNVIDEDIMEDLQGENQEISDRMLASAEKVARLRYLNMSMKENIDKELLNVAKGREEIRTNNAAIDEEIRRLQEQADQDDEHVRKELEIKQEVVKGKKRGNGFDPEIIKEATKKIKKNTEALLAAFDHKKDPLVKSVRKKLTGAEDEDDIVVQNKGMGESDIKCPYAMVTFTQPYCNKSRFPCDHHLEESSVDAMAQKAHANGFWNCPTVGCKGRWARDTSELDTKFLRRVEKYLDKMETQGAAGKGKGKGGKKASVIVDDEDEEDYTEI
jgi:hypothetical protein